MRTDLKRQWLFFLRVIANPWVIITAVAIILLAVIPTGDNSLVSTLTNIFLWLASALFGGIVSKLWMDNVEEKVVITRGKAAVRSLKLILNNLYTFEKRTNKYINKLKAEDMNKSEVIAAYEEIIERFNVLQEEVLNSIENWTDILPNIDIKTQVGIISSIKSEKESMETEIQNLTQIIEKSKGKSEEAKIELEKQLARKNQELSKIKNELREKEYKIAGSLFNSGINLSGNIEIGNSGGIVLGTKVCNSCGKVYTPSFINFNDKCNDCNKIDFSGKIGMK